MYVVRQAPFDAMVLGSDSFLSAGYCSHCFKATSIKAMPVEPKDVLIKNSGDIFVMMMLGYDGVITLRF